MLSSQKCRKKFIVKLKFKNNLLRGWSFAYDEPLIMKNNKYGMIKIIKTTSVILLGLIFSACQPNTSKNPNTDNEKSEVDVKV